MSRAQTVLAYCMRFANLAQWVVCNCSCTSCFTVTRLWDEQSGGWFLATYLSGFTTAVAVFRKPNAIPLCFSTDLILIKWKKIFLLSMQSRCVLGHTQWMKVARVWSWPLTSVLCPGEKWLDLELQHSSPSWQAHELYSFFYQLHYYYWYSALGPVWAETRAQSGDWYGSGTLHPGQSNGKLPLRTCPGCSVPATYTLFIVLWWSSTSLYHYTTIYLHFGMVKYPCQCQELQNSTNLNFLITCDPLTTQFWSVGIISNLI